MTIATEHAVLAEGASVPSGRAVGQIAIKRSDGTELTATPLAVTGTAIGTAAKTTTAPEPKANTLIAIKFTNGNSASAVTVAFNGGTARAVQCSGAATTGAKLALAATGVALFFFDGTILHQVGAYT